MVRRTTEMSVAAVEAVTHVVMSAIIVERQHDLCCWLVVKVEECLAPMTKTPVEIDHGECAQAKAAVAGLGFKVHVRAGTICYGEQLLSHV